MWVLACAVEGGWVMSFHKEMQEYVLAHGALNNPYLERFRTGELTDEEFKEFAMEFYNFVRYFPKILVTQLVHTENELVAQELTKVLYSELGYGRSRNRHELLYRDFLRSIGVGIHESMVRPMLPSTKLYLEGVEELLSSGNHDVALGASFGLENMANMMWDHLIPGLTKLRNERYLKMDMTYFAFYLDLECSHEEAMEKAVQSMDGKGDDCQGLSPLKREDFRTGVMTVLNYLEGFWFGLSRKLVGVSGDLFHHANRI